MGGPRADGRTVPALHQHLDRGRPDACDASGACRRRPSVGRGPGHRRHPVGPVERNPKRRPGRDRRQRGLPSVTPDHHYTALLTGTPLYPDHPHNLPELRGPVNDVALLRDALTDPEMGLFVANRVRVLPERSKREIATTMEEFFRKATRDDLVLLYYSGHGRRDEYDNLYLCARDTRTDLLMATAISDSEVNGMMRASAATTSIVILDCCYRGSFKGGGLPDKLRGRGRFLISSSRQGQLSADSEDLAGASAFTRRLVDALNYGTVDPDRAAHVPL